MKKYIFFITCLFVFCFSFAQTLQDDAYLTPLQEQKLRESCEKKRTSPFLTPDECFVIKSQETRQRDRQFEIHKTIYEQAKARGFSYNIASQKTQEQIAREKLIVFLIWFGGCLAVSVICFVLFRFTKNKISLRIKQRAGKHTLDDVFAAEEKE